MRIEGYMTTDEFFKITGLKISTQAKYRMEGKIPYYKIGKFILYNIQEINEWVKTFKQPFNIKYSKNKITNELLNNLK